jgi:hypothetical protein
MGNKKTATKGDKRKKEEEAKTANSNWTYSKCSRNDLLHLVSEGLLQEKDVMQWHSSFRQSYPQENVDEIILFQHFVERGLALPASDFFPSLFLWSSTPSSQPKFYSSCKLFLFIFVRPFWASSPTFLSSAIFFE